MSGLDEVACDLLLRLLAADPAARPSARQVRSALARHALAPLGMLGMPGMLGPAPRASLRTLAPSACRRAPPPCPACPAPAACAGAPITPPTHARPSRQVLAHPWLSEVEGLIAQPRVQPCAAGAPPTPQEPAAPSPGFEDRLHRAARDLACLGFSPGTPQEDAAAAAGARPLLRCGQWGGGAGAGAGQAGAKAGPSAPHCACTPRRMPLPTTSASVCCRNWPCMHLAQPPRRG